MTDQHPPGFPPGGRDPKRRFSDRVENYVRYRPDYPADVLTVLRDEIGLKEDWTLADVGSGTGISSRLFLANGNTVYGVEPNREMRAAAERLLGGSPKFHSVDGRAEATTLSAASVDAVVAAQAFHWFERQKTREEFARILKPGGWVVLLWNTRLKDATPFLRAYEALLEEFAVDYAQVKHERVDGAALEGFFERGYQTRALRNEQSLDYEALRGRLLSSSYAPSAGHPNVAPMLTALEGLFRSNECNGQVRLDYLTQVYFGHL